MQLKQHYEGKFEAFRDEQGRQFARLQYTNGAYTWFVFDYLNNSYYIIDSEVLPPESFGHSYSYWLELSNKLEKLYHKK